MSGETNGVLPRSPENMERRTEYPKPQRKYPNFSLRDRTYVVTGGGRGLGLVIAEAIVEAGADGMSSPPTHAGVNWDFWVGYSPYSSLPRPAPRATSGFFGLPEARRFRACRIITLPSC